MRMRFPAVRVRQPLGEFFAFSISAQILNGVSYSIPAEILNDNEGPSFASLFGSQRKEKKSRLKEIAEFIRTEDATFPNAIIVAANFNEAGEFITDTDLQWSAHDEGNGRWAIEIPSIHHATASIIDGQHRLHAFNQLDPNAKERSMELLCVAFLELPTPYHAYVFATINFNQKRVDRNLAYQLFGFDTDIKDPNFWSPETAAISIARRLGKDKKSPLEGHIASGVIERDSSFNEKKDFSIPVANVVDGLLSLISSNPKADRYKIGAQNNKLGRSSLQVSGPSFFRDYYLSGNDLAIYEAVANYFIVIQEMFWAEGRLKSLKKTVGIQALFDVLRYVATENFIQKDKLDIEIFKEVLKPLETYGANGDDFESSGRGRKQIRDRLIELLNCR
jgi:DNA phosphorothioation-associated DGQHR protein 1